MITTRELFETLLEKGVSGDTIKKVNQEIAEYTGEEIPQSVDQQNSYPPYDHEKDSVMDALGIQTKYNSKLMVLSELAEVFLKLQKKKSKEGGFALSNLIEEVESNFGSRHLAMFLCFFIDLEGQYTREEGCKKMLSLSYAAKQGERLRQQMKDKGIDMDEFLGEL